MDHHVYHPHVPKQVTICYLLVNISYLTVMSPSEMAISDAVAVVSNTSEKDEAEKSILGIQGDSSG